MLKKFWDRFFGPKPVHIRLTDDTVPDNDRFELTPAGRAVVRKIGKKPAKKTVKKAAPRKAAPKKKTARKPK